MALIWDKHRLLTFQHYPELLCLEIQLQAKLVNCTMTDRLTWVFYRVTPLEKTWNSLRNDNMAHRKHKDIQISDNIFQQFVSTALGNKLQLN